MDILEHILRASTLGEGASDLDAQLVRLSSCPFSRSLERAIWSGFETDRLGYAFVGGYHAALARLMAWAAESTGEATYDWPTPTLRLSLAATEAKGAHPRAIETSLEGVDGGFILRGAKTFATLATLADELLVLATRGDEGGKPRLVLVRVRPDRVDVRLEERAPLPFAPEVPHAKVTFADVSVDARDVLPGDGYAHYVKPFRTIEDIHVLASALGHLVRTARHHELDRAIVGGAIALMSALETIEARSPLDPVGHVALAGVFRTSREHFEQSLAELDRKGDAADDVRERWRRDLPLLAVAEGVRQQRSDAAWTALADAPRIGPAR